MSIRAATAYIELGADFAKFNREVRAETAKKITQKVDVNVDSAKAKAELRNLGREKVKVAVDVDHRGIAEAARALHSLYKTAALLTAAGIGAQAVSALGAAAVATTASLGPLVGAMAAVPVVATAGAQAVGVFALAVSGMSDALKAGAEAQGGDAAAKKKYAEALEKLNPEQRKFVKLLGDNAGKLDELKRSASGLFGGATVGFGAALKNFPILNKGVERTSHVLGDLLAQMGKLVGSKGFGRDLDTLMGRNDVTIRRLGRSGIYLFDALRHVGMAAGPLVSSITRLALHGARLVDVWARNGRESGRMARFFEETRRVMATTGHIVRDLGVGLLNIFKGAYPVGRSFLKLQEHLAAKFREWTESARGKNQISDFFRRARPAMVEAEKLVGAIVSEFGKLGKGNQVAPLLRQIRLELLPAFAELVRHTTTAFGPAFLEAVKQGLLLFTKIGGTSGPLVGMAVLLGTSLRLLNKLIDRFPVLGTAIATIVAVGGLAKAMGLTTALVQMRLLTSQAKILAAVQAGGGIGGAAAGAGAGAAARGVVARGAGGAAGAAGLLATLTKIGKFVLPAGLVAGLTALPFLFKKSERPASAAQQAMGRWREELHRAGGNATVARGRIESLTRQIQKVQRESGNKNFGREFVRNLNAMSSGTGRALNASARHFAAFRGAGNNSLKQLRAATSDNMRYISRTLGSHSAEGRKALAGNFKLAQAAVRDAMRDGRISTRTGMAEIRRLLRKESKYGSDGVRESYREAVQGIRRSMGDGRISTKQGMAEIRRLMRQQSRGAKQDVLEQLGDLKPKSKKKMDQVASVIVTAIGKGARGVGEQGRNAAEALQGSLENMGQNGNAILKALGIKPAKYTFKKISKKAEAKIAGSMIDRLGAQRGGMLPGQRDGDRIPALLEEGEYVVNKKAVKKMGVPQLDAINYGLAPRFAAGGRVTGDLAGLKPQFLAALRALAGATTPISVNSGYRSAAEQATLYARSDKSGRMVAAPGKSHHQQGIAADIAPQRGAYGSAPGKFGLTFPMSWEPWHIELLAGATGLAPEEVKRVLIGGPDGVLKSAAQGIADKARKAINKYIEGKSAEMGAGAGPSGPVPKGNVRAWIAAGLKLAGHAATPAAIATLYRQVMSESGGNPHAVNNWDSNAKAGHPSKGLLQTIDSTFRSYMVPGHGDVFNPIDNVAAAVRYMFARYGHLVGTGSGYQAGGLVRRMAGGGHVVRKGDTLEEFAKRYHTTPAALKRINKLKHPIHAGQRLFTTAARVPKVKSMEKQPRHRPPSPLGQDAKLAPPTVKGLKGTLANLREHISDKTGKLTDYGKQAWGTLTDRVAHIGLPDVSGYGDTVERDDAIAQAAGSLQDNDALQAYLLQVQNQVGRALSGPEQDPLIAQWLQGNASVQGKFSLGWMYQKLHDLGMQRYKLIQVSERAKGALAQFAKDLAYLRKRRDEIAEAIKKAIAERKKQIAKLADLKKDLAKAKTKAKKAVVAKKIKATEDNIDDYGKQIHRWQGEYELLGGDSGLVAQFAGRRNLHTTALEGLQSSLRDVQGPVTAADAVAYVDARAMKDQPINRFLGQILDTRLAMRADSIASHRLVPDAVDSASTADAVDAGTTDTSGTDAMLELQKQLKEQAQQALAVSQAQYPVIRDFLKQYPQYGGSFARGGVIPGPLGEARIIEAHAGETVIPAGAGEPVVHVHIHPTPGMPLDKLIDTRIERQTSSYARGARRGLPGRGGGR